MFRQVELPTAVEGRMFLHRMPGRGGDSLAAVWDSVRAEKISCIVSLADLEETRRKSPAFADAIENASLPCERICFPIPDFGVPDDSEKFRALAHALADRLRNADRLVIHCGAGIGRTGTLAVCVLLALGEQLGDALRTVEAAESHPETSEQISLVEWFAHQVQSR